MLLREVTEPLEEKQVWARKGTKVVRKYRCGGGQRAGRIVANPTQCFKAIDIKKRANMKRTRARLGGKWHVRQRRLSVLILHLNY